MHRKGWIVAAILVGLMVVGIGGGVILAHSGKGGGGLGKSDGDGVGLAARVAEILELEESDVTDAFETVKENWDKDTDFVAEAAIILGVEEADLEDALAQARRDMANEAVSARMDALVENEKLTREQADEYIEWFEDRPEFLERAFVGPRLGGWGRGGKVGGHWRMKGSDQDTNAETSRRGKFRR